jgi:BirA family transcriptional regulator, biotin operon repressor / biotin---[acetyl-CoA-carboxylase] ligase
MSTQCIGSHIVHLIKTDSTNEYVTQLLKSNRPEEGTVFITDHQTHGRGMDTHSWESEPGKNLTFSILLYPHYLPVARQFMLNQVIAVGLSEFVRNKVNEHVTIKWPNDIYIGNKKVCGTLIQSSIISQSFDFVVIGIGLNVNQLHFTSPAPNPVSLQNVTGIEYNLYELLEELCIILDRWYEQLRSGNSRTIRENYLSALYRLNEWYKYSIRENECDARITGISQYGQLILQGTEEKQYVCDIKEVIYL